MVNKAFLCITLLMSVFTTSISIKASNGSSIRHITASDIIHLDVSDLYYDSPTKNPIIACTSRCCKYRSHIYIYNTAQSKFIQTIKVNIPTATELGCAFSENGKFLTVGAVRSLTQPQEFHVYENIVYTRRSQHVVRNLYTIPLPLQKIILAYAYEYEPPCYVLYSLVQYKPSFIRRYITGHRTIFDRFAYDSTSQTISCYGSALNKNELDFECVSPGYIQPVGIVDASGTNKMLPYISPGLICTYNCSGNDDGDPEWQYISSANKRYIIYETGSGRYRFLDRLKNIRKILPHIPHAFDNINISKRTSNSLSLLQKHIHYMHASMLTGKK